MLSEGNGNVSARTEETPPQSGLDAVKQVYTGNGCAQDAEDDNGVQGSDENSSGAMGSNGQDEANMDGSGEDYDHIIDVTSDQEGDGQEADFEIEELNGKMNGK